MNLELEACKIDKPGEPNDQGPAPAGPPPLRWRMWLLPVGRLRRADQQCAEVRRLSDGRLTGVMERQPDRCCFMRFCGNRLQAHAFRRRKHDWTGSFTAESNASSVNRAMPASDSTRWDVRGVVTLVVSGDARPIAALCRAPLAPTAFLEEEQHATRRAAEAKSLALWTTEQVDTRSCHDRERGVRSILGYLDNPAVGSLVDPIQSIPVW